MLRIKLEISNPCNEHCIHCYRHCLNSKKEFLTAEQSSSVIKQSVDLGATEIVITGGEALLNPDWKKIINCADFYNLKIELFTNGSLISEDDAIFLTKIKKLKEVHISLYALDSEIHDLITQHKGSCSKTKRAINLLREHNIPLFISCPVMKENKTAALEVMRWCDDNNIKSCADLFIFGESDYTGNNLKHRLSFYDLKFFFDETMKDNARLSYVWGNGYGKQNLNEIEFYGDAAHSLCVSGDGNIYPAIGWYEPLGNISADSLKDIFENHQLLKQLRTIHASDIEACENCKSSDFCDFCFSPHITANKGELRKLDNEYCKFVKVRKEFAFIRDVINYIQSAIGKSIVKTENLDVYFIKDIGNFVIKKDSIYYEHLGEVEKKEAIFGSIDSFCDEDDITIAPVANCVFGKNTSHITVRKTDANNFEFYGSDGKKLLEKNIFDELEKIYNVYNNPQKLIKK